MRFALPVALLVLAAPVAKGQPVTRCLPVEAGQQLSRLVDSGELATRVGPGWSVESANIEISRLLLTFKGDSGQLAGVILTDQGPGTSRGRWFAYQYFNSHGPPLEKELETLQVAADLVDRAFESSPWTVCLEAAGETDQPPDGLNPDDPDYRQAGPGTIAAPPWLFLLLGFLELLVILLGLASALWNRTPPPTRSRP